MKMPHVIPDLIRNPGIKAWIPAAAGMTMYFHINPHAFWGTTKDENSHLLIETSYMEISL